MTVHILNFIIIKFRVHIAHPYSVLTLSILKALYIPPDKFEL